MRKAISRRDGFDANPLSNFDYILALNTLAGRSYLDITQYPVFPHVIADYESDAVDLNDPKTFRDLVKTRRSTEHKTA